MRIKAIIACVLWGSAFAGAKIGLQYSDPIFLSGIRFILAALLLLPVMYYKKVDISHHLSHWKFILTFAFIQTFLQYGLFFLGIHRVTGAISAIIVGSGPLVVALLAHIILKDDKITFRKMVVIFLGLAGIIFISWAKGLTISDGTTFYIGVGLLFLSVIAGAYSNIMVTKKKNDNISPFALTTFAHFIGGVMLLVVSLIVEKPVIKDFPVEFYGALLWLAFISATGFSIWYGLLNRPTVKVSELNIWKFIIPITGTVLSWLFVKGEYPDFPTILGVIIISLALILTQMNNFAVRTKK